MYPWEKLVNSPLFFWPAPVDLDKLEEKEKRSNDRQRKKEIKRIFKKNSKDSDAKYKDKIKRPGGVRLEITETTFQRPRALIYDSLLEFNKARL